MTHQLFFITKTQGVHCAVGTEYLNTRNQVNLVLVYTERNYVV